MHKKIRKLYMRSGSAIIIILITVALFGALSWAWMENSRSSVGWLTSEQTKAAQTMSAGCQQMIDAGMKKLQSRGCGDFTSADETGALFGAVGEPTDGSCALYHPNGGGVKPCGGNLDAYDPCFGTPPVGQRCLDGSIYAGLSPDGNKRMFTTPADFGSAMFYTLATDPPVPVGTSGTSGKSNTAAQVALNSGGLPYQAAGICDALVAHGKTDWYLPANGELAAMCPNKTAIGMTNAYYWSSIDQVAARPRAYTFNTCGQANSNANSNALVRCTRRDP